MGLGFLIGVANFLWALTASYASEDIVIIALFWTTCNMGLLGLGIGGVLRRLYRRKSYRFRARVAGTMAWGNGRVVRVLAADLSAEGVGLLARADVPVGERIAVTLDLPDGPLTIRGMVAHVHPLADGMWKVGVSLTGLGSAERERWIRFLFVTLARCQHSAGVLCLGVSPSASTHVQPVDALPFSS